MQPIYYLLFFGTFFFIPKANAQYILNGNATKESCNCYVLTEPINNQIGSVWQSKKIDLNNPFDFSFNVFLGCDITGADGIVFILQPNSTGIGKMGGGLGFESIVPSIGILLDTYQNPGDPSYDHINIQANGVIDPSKSLAGPIPISNKTNNVKDCAWHDYRIVWDPVTTTLSTYFDGVFRLSINTNLIVDIFNNDPMVYWGFSAATGGENNLQKFCTALTPGVNSGLANDAICDGGSINFTDNSVSFTTIKNYSWDFGDGNTSSIKNPIHTYGGPGIYQVKHSFIAEDGCESNEYSKTVSVGDYPVLSMDLFDTCQYTAPRLQVNPQLEVGKINNWNWNVDGSPFSAMQNPDFTKLSPGNHSIDLTVKSDIGCASNKVNKPIEIFNAPEANFEVIPGCIDKPVSFSGIQSNSSPDIVEWKWSFGDNTFSDQRSTIKEYNQAGDYPVQLTVVSDKGCSANFTKAVRIIKAIANAGKDTIVVENSPFQLKGGGGVLYAWTPSTGLNNPNIASPTGIIANDIQYKLKVTIAEGCTDTSSVNIIVFKGSAIYVPNAFTPNNDGVNDFLKPYYVGIKKLAFFDIYNRWGQKVFSTNDMNKGWNGYFKGDLNWGESYVWVLRAEDLIGKKYQLKGNFILLR